MTRIMYDSVNPDAIPTNAQMVAGYIDGQTYRWPDNAWTRFPYAVKVRIARRVSTNDGHVLDVEAGIPTVWPPTNAIVQWVQMRRQSGVEPTVYCNELNDWGNLRQLFRNAGVREPNWWVARYNNVQTIPAGAIARQFANPPLAGGHYDLSIVADYWPGVDGPNTQGDSDMTQEEHNMLAYLVSQVQKVGTQTAIGAQNGNAPKHTDFADTVADMAGLTWKTWLNVGQLLGRPVADVDEEALAQELTERGFGGMTAQQFLDIVGTLRFTPAE